MTIKVYTSGVFDLFHVGHLRALEKAKALGHYLLVGVHTDEEAISYKRKPVIPFKHRCQIVSAIYCVDEVMQGPLHLPDNFYDEFKIDFHCQGVDLKGHYTIGNDLGITRYVGRSDAIDTTRIIRRIIKMFA